MKNLLLTIAVTLGMTATTIAQLVNPGSGLIDIEGNSYPTVVFGNGTEWMTANLLTSSFSNGDSIPLILNSTEWNNSNFPCWASYNNDNLNDFNTGKLYNFYTVADPRNICPIGWSVPSKYAFDSLLAYFGGGQLAGGKLKEAGFSFWNQPNLGATNESLFNGRPNGLRFPSGQYFDFGNIAYIWTSTADGPFSAYRLNLFFNNTQASTSVGANKNAGLAIRCYKSIPSNPDGCNINSITIPTDTIISSLGNSVQISSINSDSLNNFIWQTNALGLGWLNLSDNQIYSGVTTANLNISNLQYENQHQKIRVIGFNEACRDTSENVIIQINDTCITSLIYLDTVHTAIFDTTEVIVYDYDTITTYTTVTDTLLINTIITEINPPNNANTIKVFPNPAYDHINIDYGNFSIMTGYQLQIENSLGQQVFQTDITQQSDYLNLSNWGGNGLYFVRIIDPQGNTIDIRKIVLQ